MNPKSMADSWGSLQNSNMRAWCAAALSPADNHFAVVDDVDALWQGVECRAHALSLHVIHAVVGDLGWGDDAVDARDDIVDGN